MATSLVDLFPYKKELKISLDRPFIYYVLLHAVKAAGQGGGTFSINLFHYVQIIA
jgi:hypothetical protein